MAQVIIFGGGDAGGIIITEHGVRRIPPFDPGILLQLRGVSSLAQSTLFARAEHLGQEFASLLNKLSNVVVGRVEAVVGQLDAENSLVYQDDEGGFTCGSTGKPPIPFPKKAPSVPHLSDVLSRGVISAELLEFVGAANEKKIPLRDVLADPAAVAKQLKLKLSDRSLRALQQLSPASTGKIADPTSREIAGFFTKVVEDGRHIVEFAREPSQVARELGIKLSDKAIDRIVAGGSVMHDHDPGTVENPVAIAVVVGVVIMLVDDVAMVGVEKIVDVSGVQKL
ncbi:MAG TPA: hypothetical protein VGD08_19545 [Stellaceae bacterium]|jgi:hypothetical protein